MSHYSNFIDYIHKHFTTDSHEHENLQVKYGSQPRRTMKIKPYPETPYERHMKDIGAKLYTKAFFDFIEKKKE